MWMRLGCKKSTDNFIPAPRRTCTLASKTELPKRPSLTLTEIAKIGGYVARERDPPLGSPYSFGGWDRIGMECFGSRTHLVCRHCLVGLSVSLRLCYLPSPARKLQKLHHRFDFSLNLQAKHF